MQEKIDFWSGQGVDVMDTKSGQNKYRDWILKKQGELDKEVSKDMNNMTPEKILSIKNGFQSIIDRTMGKRHLRAVK